MICCEKLWQLLKKKMVVVMSRCLALNKTNARRCEKPAVLDGLCMTHYSVEDLRRVSL